MYTYFLGYLLLFFWGIHPAPASFCKSPVSTQTVNGQPGKGDWLRRGTYEKARKYLGPAAVPVPFSGRAGGVFPWRREKRGQAPWRQRFLLRHIGLRHGASPLFSALRLQFENLRNAISLTRPRSSHQKPLLQLPTCTVPPTRRQYGGPCRGRHRRSPWNPRDPRSKRWCSRKGDPLPRELPCMRGEPALPAGRPDA